MSIGGSVADCHIRWEGQCSLQRYSSHQNDGPDPSQLEFHFSTPMMKQNNGIHNLGVNSAKRSPVPYFVAKKKSSCIFDTSI